MISTADLSVFELLKMLGGAASRPTGTDIDSFLDSNVGEADARRIKEVLSDEKKTRALLESQAARELLKKLGGGDFGG